MALCFTKICLEGSLARREISRMQRASRPRGGFTLVEVLVLLVIIAFLLAMAVMALQKIRQGRQEKAPAPAAAPATAGN
jgi:Tfp pilus assembly protein PilX